MGAALRGTRGRADALVAGEAFVAAAVARDQVEFVGEESDTASLPLTRARYADHSWLQSFGSARANSRMAFMIGLSRAMDSGGEEKLGGIFVKF